LQQLKAHKLVLGASSPVFFAMFYGPLAQSASAQQQKIAAPNYHHQQQPNEGQHQQINGNY
jgi:hypothetical protein